MTAVDTNVLVRLLVEDDRSQAKAATQLFQSDQIWVSKTVLLETEWVLRSLYGFDEAAIRHAFTNLLGIENVKIEDESAVAVALTLTSQGIELADALHLSSRPAEASFVSFDRAFVRRAKLAGVKDISVLTER